MKLKFHVKAEEYRKYGAFQKVDPELDRHTTVYMDRRISSMISDLRRFSETIDLYEGSGDVYATTEGYFAFQKALASHLSFVWYDLVPHWPLALKDMQVSKRQELLSDRVNDLRRGKSRYNWVMPRYVAGLFEYPLLGISIFPQSVSLEYAFCSWAVDRQLGFYADDADFLMDTRDRLKEIVEFAVAKVEKHLVPRL